MPSEPYLHAIDCLTQLGPQRAWSLVVTVFGDMAQARDQSLAGPTLSLLMTDMKVKPDALRVALHRLRADGWITSQKNGRTSRHALSEKGRRESQVATPVIYRRPEDMPSSWHAILLPDADSENRTQLLAKGYVPVSPRLFVGSDLSRPPKDALVLEPTVVPAWVKSQLQDESVAREYETLHTALLDVQTALTELSEPSDIQIAVLRCLIVHNWRRLVLKHPALPKSLYPTEHKGTACRSLVMDLLDSLPRPTLA